MNFFHHFDVSISLTGTGFNTEKPAVLLAVIVLALLLEWFLARRERRWPGLILPALALLWAAGISLLGYGTASSFLDRMGLGLWALVRLFLWSSVPALALLAVYAACRWRRRRKLRRGRELDSMRVEDL